MKFSYFREALRESGKQFLGIVNLRGKEHIVLLKPYFNGLIGLGVYHFDRIRDVKEISGYNEQFNVDKKTIKQMSKKIQEKESIAIKDIANKREERIREIFERNTGLDTSEQDKMVEENPLELVSF